MNLTDAMNIGRSGLLASSRGSNVAAQNLTNASTPGYSRRRLELDPVPLDWGGGVRAGQASRVTDQFLERRGLGARAFSGETDARVKTLAVVDEVFADGQGTVGEALDEFDAALTDLSVSPQSKAVRQVVLAKADDLAKSFHRAQDALRQTHTDANESITNELVAINDSLDRIGELNLQIVAGKNAGEDVGDLEDQRDELVRGIAKAMPTQVIEDDSGAISVILSGSRTLVEADGAVTHLISNFDATTGKVSIGRETSGQLEDITGFFTTGSIGGTITARDGALQDAIDSLDQLAFDIATSYSAAHLTGVALDGTTGRNFFDPITAVQGAAEIFNVSGDVKGQPDNIAAAQANTSLPGDNRNALAMVGLRDQLLARGGTATFQQAFSAMVAEAGSAARTAQDQSEHAEATLTQLDSLRESVSGVSTDEEMMNLMKFQRAYQASLRVIETADSMLSDLIHMRAGG